MAGPRPLDLFIKAVPYRLVVGLSYAVILKWTLYIGDLYDKEFPIYYYVAILIVFITYQVRLGI